MSPARASLGWAPRKRGWGHPAPHCGVQVQELPLQIFPAAAFSPPPPLFYSLILLPLLD